ncbi:MAG: hypothetical protein U1E45_11750 [Geminicoccaceae bacterium]
MAIEQAQAGHHPSLKERAAEEGKRFLIMFLYLWVLFALFALHEKMVLRELHTVLPSQGFAFVNALVLAKVMLLAEGINFGGWLQGRPLIWPILHESVVFALLFIAVHYLEGIVVGWFHDESLGSSVPAVGGGGLAGLVCVAVIMAVSLVPFFAFRDVNRALGGNRLAQMVFGTRGRQ